MNVLCIGHATYDVVIPVSDCQAYKQFGNSVVIDVLQLIGIEIGHAVEKNQKLA